MDTCIESCLNAIQFQNSFIHARLEVIPLFSSQDHSPEYLTLGQAMLHNRLLVTEVSKTGAVPELKVVNKGKIPILLLDGEELAGAKQNRVLNTTILVPGESELVIPVSCTEHGRWTYSSPVFHDSRVMMDYKIRARKMASVSMSRKHRACHASDQMGIWEDIEQMAKKAKVSSPTGAMKDVFESSNHAMDEYLAAFPLQPGQQGVLVYMEGRPAGMEFLSRPEAYARTHDKLMRSYVMEALIDDEIQQLLKDKVQLPKEFLQRVASCTSDAYPAVGLGTEHRFGGTDLVGSALLHEGVVVHLACFNTECGADPDVVGRMASFRARRSSHMAGRERNPNKEYTDVW